MKRIYWRPQGTSLTALLLICAFSVGGFVSVEKFQTRIRQPHYPEKIAAAQLAREAMELLRNERLKQDTPINPEYDPAQSGLIGLRMTPVTSDPGDLDAKQTSVNPNFAAVVVELLKELKVRQGDVVAVSFTGSFPALNICVCAALQTLKLDPIIISTLGASQWGANVPGFLWIDMERLLNENHLFSFRSTAVSMGGKGDRGLDMGRQGRKLMTEAIEKDGLTSVQWDTLREDIDQRMMIYHKKKTPKVFINVGGGMIAVGKKVHRRFLRSGVILSRSPVGQRDDSVMRRFLEEGVPTIHFEDVKRIASHYGLELHPAKIPPVGEGKAFYREEYNRLLAAAILLGIILILYIFARSDVGFRIFQTSHKEELGPPEPMI